MPIVIVAVWFVLTMVLAFLGYLKPYWWPKLHLAIVVLACLMGVLVIYGIVAFLYREIDVLRFFA